MLITIFLLAIAAIGGASLSFLVRKEAYILWRVAVGIAAGSAVFATVLFLLSFAMGLSPVSIAIVSALMIATVLIPLKLFRDQARREWRKARGKLDGANWQKIGKFLFYAGFLLLFLLFFDRAFFSTDEGIFTGASQNFGDLPFHLGAVFSFAFGDNFPPQNPSFAGATFSYPFISDLFSAAAVKLGADVANALFVPSVAWAFSLLVILEDLVTRLIGKTNFAKIAGPLLFFSGGLGFIWFFGDYFAQGRGFFELLRHLPTDYTIGPEIRWGNSLITLFITQRSILLGMPLTLMILAEIWEWAEDRATGLAEVLRPTAIGLLTGLLVLVHLHSLAMLFVVSLFWMASGFKNLRTWLIFGASAALVAIPELIWSSNGSASDASKFIGWNFGWDTGDTNIFWFWLKNTGFAIPVLLAGFYLSWRRSAGGASDDRERGNLLVFYIPFAVLFIICNAAKFAPWQWDNIKILIYWFIGSIPLIIIALQWVWNYANIGKMAATVCFTALILSGSLDVWRTVSRQINTRVFDADAVRVAETIRSTTDPHSLFLNAPTFNTAVVLSGRQSLIRYPGHLSSHGIEYADRERDVKTMYRGGPAAIELLHRYGIKYVLISPIERSTLGPNEAFFARFPVVAEAGQYRVYDVRRVS